MTLCHPVYKVMGIEDATGAYHTEITGDAGDVVTFANDADAGTYLIQVIDSDGMMINEVEVQKDIAGSWSADDTDDAHTIGVVIPKVIASLAYAFGRAHEMALQAG